MKHIKPLPPIEQLLDCFVYNPDEGLMYSKKTHKQVPGYDHNGYLRISFKGILYRLSRIMWLMHTGREPTGVIDHIDGDTKNNKINNLRDVTQETNSRNRNYHRGDKVLGVYFNKTPPKWRVYKLEKGKQTYQGWFDSKQQAEALSLSINYKDVV